MSYFEKLAMEGADLGYENDAPLANGEETHTVANEIAEVQGLAQEAADAEEGAQKLDDEAEKTEELAENVEADVAAENILDPTAAKFLRLAFKNIVGAKYADKKLPATESWSGTRSQAKENTRIALEGIKDTLKSFWEAIKAQFKKVYNKVKSWIVKTFSAARKLKDRAEALQKRANDTVGTIEEKSFSFGQTKAIAVDGKYNDAGAVLGGLAKVKDAVNTSISVLKKGNVDDAIEVATHSIKNSFTGSGASRGTSFDGHAKLSSAIAGHKKGMSTVPSSVGDQKKYIEQYGDAAEIDVNGTFGLPGGKALIVVTPKGSAADLEGQVKAYKAFRVALANDKYNPREISEGDVKTLTTSQIDKVCDDVIDIAENIYDYEKNWKEREKVVEKVQKEVDDLVKEFEQEDDAKDKEQRVFRNFLNAQMGLMRREINFSGNLCSYSLTTGNAFLNYAERSLGQHKSK